MTISTNLWECSLSLRESSPLLIAAQAKLIYLFFYTAGDSPFHRNQLNLSIFFENYNLASPLEVTPEMREDFVGGKSVTKNCLDLVPGSVLMRVMRAYWLVVGGNTPNEVHTCISNV